MSAQLSSRLAKELQLLQKGSEGCTAWPQDGLINQLEAVITGPSDTPYKGGQFRLTISLPDRYPFEPPKLKFVTPVYHPNIDGEGRVCLDLLNMPPKAEEFLQNREVYSAKAREMTLKHAVGQ